MSSDRQKLFHASLECAQHGDKSLLPRAGAGQTILQYAKRVGYEGVQLSAHHLTDPDTGLFYPATTIKQALADNGLKLDGISAHCPFWCLGTAWTNARGLRKFLSKDLLAKGSAVVEETVEGSCLALMDLSVELDNFFIAMFWGDYYGLEVASGYPWGMWELPEGEDLVKEGDDRFRTKTEKVRTHARERGLKLGHEIHRGTGLICATDYKRVKKEVLDNDECVVVNADATHCWENEDFHSRFRLVGDDVFGVHAKDNEIIPGISLSSMEKDWKKRAMRFRKLGRGTIKLDQYVHLMMEVGYVRRFRALQKLPETATVPIVAEAEDAFEPLDVVSAEAATYIKTNYCVDFATVSFEKNLGK